MPAAGLRIVIPAHNEESRLERTLNAYCTRFEGVATIVVVANACRDGTPALVRRLQARYANLRLIDVRGTIGKGGAVRAGLIHAQEPHLGFVDADGSTPAEEFFRLYRECVERRADALIASRWVPGAVLTPPQPWRRRIGSRVFNTVVRVLFGLPFADTQCGAKIFSRAALRTVESTLEAADFAFDIELLWRLRRAGFRIDEVPTRWCDDSTGSTVSLGKSGLRMLRTVLRMRLCESAVRHLPFGDAVGRRHAIPSKPQTSVLVLGDEQAAAPLVEALRRRGTRVATDTAVRPPIFASSELVRRVYFLLWYVLRSHREYDAVVEYVGRIPAGVPLFSAKPCFLAVENERRSYVRRCARAARLDPALAPDSAAALILESAEGHGYLAVFQPHEGRTVLSYRDQASGTRVRDVLIES